MPVLFHIFSGLDMPEAVRMHVAVGTSLASIIATSSVSIKAHAKRGAVDTDMLKSWGPWIFLGVVAGAVLAGMVRGPVLTAVFAVIALIVALHMGFGRACWRLSDHLPTGAGRAVLASGIGGFSVMMGIGGGTLSVPILSLFGYPIHRAVGTAAAIGFVIGIPGALGFVMSGWNAPDLPPFSLGYVNLLGIAVLLPTSMTLAPVGARLAHSLNTQRLRQAFAIFLAMTSLRMFYSVLS